MDPITFQNARRTCRGWYISSFNLSLLKDQLCLLGYNEPDVVESNSMRYLSMRLSRECLLGSARDGTCGLVQTTTFDFSELSSNSTASTIHFTVSVCGKYVLLSEGCIVYVYRLCVESVEYVASIICPRRVLAVSMDTSIGRYAVAILVDGRIGIVAEIGQQNNQIRSPEPRSTYKCICSEDDPPRSVAICPQRACVAFGCQGSIELHWIDAVSGQELNRWFPLSAPSDFLYFLPPRTGIDSLRKLRLISSAVHPEEVSPMGRRFGVTRGSFAYWGAWEPRDSGMAQSDHYMAVPVGDGIHVLFTDPDDDMVYLGGDAPLGGPTKLLRRIKLIPPKPPAPPPVTRRANNNESSSSRQIGLSTIMVSDGGHDGGPMGNCLCPGDDGVQGIYYGRPGRRREPLLDGELRPRVYAAGQDLSHGARIAVGYGDWLVFYSVPTEIFNQGIPFGLTTTRCSGRTAIHSTNEIFFPRTEPVEILGCHVAYVPGLIDIAVDSGPNMAVWAFNDLGEVKIFRLDGTFDPSSPDIGRNVLVEWGGFANVDGVVEIESDNEDDDDDDDRCISPAGNSLRGERESFIEMDECRGTSAASEVKWMDLPLQDVMYQTSSSDDGPLVHSRQQHDDTITGWNTLIPWTSGEVGEVVDTEEVELASLAVDDWPWGESRRSSSTTSNHSGEGEETRASSSSGIPDIEHGVDFERVLRRVGGRHVVTRGVRGNDGEEEEEEDGPGYSINEGVLYIVERIREGPGFDEEEEVVQGEGGMGDTVA
ncbi:hypothetical protein DFH27DRAFT_398326 [Peziza echinospora]|nr:hypothetical protein DFH27DRAFT_398326 [Peziza echinospora]